MRILLIICTFYLMNISTHALTLDELQTQFSQHPVTRADFLQKREIKGMNMPLTATGQFIISKTAGLWWHQQTPFELTLRLNQQIMIQTVQGQKPEKMTVQSHPQLFQFNDLLTALFRGDLQLLEQKFKLEFKELDIQKTAPKRINTPNTSDTWRLVLTPKAAPLNRIFKSITLKGNHVLNTIEMHDLQGDFTHIQLSNQRVEPPELDQDEQRYFMP